MGGLRTRRARYRPQLFPPTLRGSRRRTAGKGGNGGKGGNDGGEELTAWGAGGRWLGPMHKPRPSTLASLAVVVLMAVVWIWPLVGLGEQRWATHSNWFDASRAQMTVEAWRAGIADARWFPSADYGYGYPFLWYYAPMFSWVAGGLLALTGKVSLAIRLAAALWLAVGVTGMWAAGARFWGMARGESSLPLAGGIAAAAWLASPYPLVGVYIRGTGPEFAAMQMLPWVFWAGLGLLARTGPLTRRDGAEAVLSAFFLALAVLSHNYLGLMALGLAFAMPLFAAALRWGGGCAPFAARRLLLHAGALAYALALSAFWWAPAFLERGFVRDEGMRIGEYHHSRHFLHLWNYLIVGYWGSGGSFPGPRDTLTLHLGFAGVLGLASAACALVVGDRKVRSACGTLLAAIAAAIFLTHWSSEFLWDHFALLSTGQFPWRFLALGTLGVALAAPAFLCVPGRAARITGLVLIGTTALASAVVYRHPLSLLPAPREIVSVDPRYDHLRTAIMDEFGPAWRPDTADRGAPPDSVMPGEGLTILDAAVDGSSAMIAMEHRGPETSRVVLARNYFPGWTARLLEGDSPELVIGPENGTGFIELTGIPPGRSVVAFTLEATPTRHWARLLSVGALLALILIGIRIRRMPRESYAERT